MSARAISRLRSASTWSLLALASCDQHLDIGSVLDAGEGDPKPGPAVAANTLGARLRSHDREGVSRLVAPCPGECSKIEVSTEAGSTPLSVHWSDGAEGAGRELCVVGPLRLSVRVEDQTMPERQETLALELLTDSCDVAVPSGLPWQVCQRVTLREQPGACGAAELAGAVIHPLDGWDSSQPASLRLLFRVPRAVTATIEASTAAAGCRERRPLPSSSLRFGPFDVGEVWFELPRPQLAALLILRASDAAAALPAGVTLEALEVCEAL